MGVGLYNKLKKAFKAIGERVGIFAKKAMNALPKIASVGHDVISKVSPILSNVIPGSGLVLNTIDNGLSYANKFANSLRNNGIGKSLIKEID